MDTRFQLFPDQASTMAPRVDAVFAFVAAIVGFFTMLIGLVIFAWGASLYFDIVRTPDNALEVYVTGRQWMWHLQHPDGQREINQLHIPVGRAIKLIMTSEDVIHDFFIPAFRVKQDV